MFRQPMTPQVLLMVFISFLTLFAASTATAQTTLNLGDIAFTGYNADTPDGWTFVLLKDVAINTTITFVDHGWFAAGGFRATENELTWTATAALMAGTQVTIDASVPSASSGSVAGDTFGLATSGDQLFAYQGAAPTAGDESNFLTGIQMNGSWDGDSTSSNTSAQPSVFTDGVNSISIDPEIDNGVYDCSTEGPTVSDVRAAANTAANWTTSGSVLTLPPMCDFSAVPVELMTFSIE